jgi:hypothetical protein
MEEKHGLHHTLQDKLEFYWKEFSNALKMYQENNQDRKLAFEELKAKDDDSAQEIDAQMRKLTRISVCQFFWCIFLIFLKSNYEFLQFMIASESKWDFLCMKDSCM